MSLAIATLAGTLSVGAIVSNHYSRQENNQNMNAYESTTMLDRDVVLDEANNCLTNIVLPNGSHYDNAFVTYPSRDEYHNINSLQVYKKIRINDYFVYRYISGQDINKNNPEIVNEFLDTILEVANTSTPSQELLTKLQDLTDKVSKMDLTLDGNNIIDLNEKDNELDRD